MQAITKSFLEAQVARINRMTGNPLESYTLNNGKYVANIGNYHLDGAYGGWELQQMCNESGGVRDIFRCGHVSKRELSERLDAFIQGLEAAKAQELQPA